MKNVLIPLCFILLILTSCEDKTEILPIAETEVNLSSPQIGQKTNYIQYQSNCEDFDNDLHLDEEKILTLEVIEMENGGLGFKEFYPPESSLHTGTDSDVIATYPIEKTENGLKIPSRESSFLFFFYGDDFIRFNTDDRIDLNQQGCMLYIDDEPFIGEEIGRCKDVKIAGKDFNDKTAVSCVPNFELDAFLVYDQYQLHCSHVIGNDDWFQETFVQGWVLQE